MLLFEPVMLEMYKFPIVNIPCCVCIAGNAMYYSIAGIV